MSGLKIQWRCHGKEGSMQSFIWFHLPLSSDHFDLCQQQKKKLHSVIQSFVIKPMKHQKVKGGILPYC